MGDKMSKYSAPNVPLTTLEGVVKSIVIILSLMRLLVKNTKLGLKGLIAVLGCIMVYP